jgi:hypothetical protein
MTANLESLTLGVRCCLPFALSMLIVQLQDGSMTRI